MSDYYQGFLRNSQVSPSSTSILFDESPLQKYDQLHNSTKRKIITSPTTQLDELRILCASFSAFLNDDYPLLHRDLALTFDIYLEKPIKINSKTLQIHYSSVSGSFFRL
jgi:hypothetical protein